MSSKKVRKLKIVSIPASDKDLAEQAKKKAGGPTALGRLFGVTPGAASQWGRRVPIPRHLKPRIEAFVSSRDYGIHEGGASPTEPPEGLTAEEWKVVRPLLLQLRDIWRAKGIPGHGDRWQAIVWNIEGFADLVRRDFDPGVREEIQLHEGKKQSAG